MSLITCRYLKILFTAFQWLLPGFSKNRLTSATAVAISGRVEIIKNELEDRKLLPRKALIGNSVFVVKDGKVEIRDVIIGAKNLMMVEVIEGLNANDIVVIETPHLLRDGQSIRPILIKGEN